EPWSRVQFETIRCNPRNDLRAMDARHLLCAAPMSTQFAPFGDESWRLCDIQFDDPEVGVGLSPPLAISSTRALAGVGGANGLPHTAAVRGEAPLEQRAGDAAIAALDEDGS